MGGGRVRKGKEKKEKALLYITAPPPPLEKSKQGSPILGGGRLGPAWTGITRSPPTSLAGSTTILSPGWLSKKLCCLVQLDPRRALEEAPSSNKPSSTPPFSTRRLCERGSSARLSTSPAERNGGGCCKKRRQRERQGGKQTGKKDK